MWNNKPKHADIVVGVDFGMTCSGVAYSMGPEWPEPRTIQHWPGKLGHEIRNKVETSVAYDVVSRKLKDWGFLCNPDHERDEYNSLFKLYLDPNYHDGTPDPPSCEDAQQWYLDYMTCLYHCIIQYFTDRIARFPEKSIDFVFSVPVTWRSNPAMLARIEHIIHTAGFGSRERDTASVYLTEAEAAAIYASKQSMTRGDVFLVCDAGGGTTDLNVLKVESAMKGNYELLPLSWTEGAAVGSTLIDFKVRSLIRERLSAIEQQLPDNNIDAIVTLMMQHKFETFKCSFGSPGMDVPKLMMSIPGVSAGLNVPHAKIEDSKLIVTRAELQEIFDDQIEKMCSLIDKQIRLVQERHNGEIISYLVLSGGLGSSPYVQSRLRARYEGAGGGLHPGTVGLKLLGAHEPQLAVVHGLVAARTQSSKGGPEIYAMRCSPVSFGIMCRELYDPVKHQGETVVQDPFDGKRWAERQINWIIKQGEVVRAEAGAKHRYRLKIAMGKERDPWRAQIVMSTLPAKQLPQSMKRYGAREVCAVEAVLDESDMKRKNRHWYNLGTEYNRAEFEIRMLIGTGLKFEIWGRNGHKSKDHGEIEVQWESVDGHIPPPSSNGIEGHEMYPQ